MEYGDKLKQKRLELGLTMQEVADKVGVSKPTIQRYESGIIDNMRKDKIALLAKALQVTPEFILGIHQDFPLNVIPLGTMHRIPVIGSVHCGFGGEAVEDFLGYDMADVKNPEEYRYFNVKGDSMETEIHDGNRALVHIQPDVESGELAVVIINGDEGCLKKVIKQGDSIILQSFNPNYPPRIFSGEQLNELCIWGRVVKTEKTW